MPFNASGERASAPCFADTVSKEPCTLVGDLKNSVQLMGADALLAAGHHVEGLEHLVERDASMLKHGANLHGELFFAVAAAIQAEADSLGSVGLDLR